MKNLFISLIIVGITTVAFAQVETVPLEEVELLSVNYKYLDATGDEYVARPVKLLERKVAAFDLASLEGFEDEEQDYYVYFNIPKGRILAIYDNEGVIMRTSERFKDIRLPLSVTNAIVERYPGWRITGDIYRVSYIKNRKTTKTYKLFITKDGKHKRVKTDEVGNFI